MILPRIHRRIFQFVAAVGVNLGMISLGMHYGWTSTSLNVLTSGNYTFQIDNDVASWLASIVPIGSGLGDIIAAFTTNIIGRKHLISATIIPLALSWILVAAAPNVTYMFIGRFIAGVCDGLLFTAAPSYLAEISDPEIRGFLGTTYAVTIVGGMLLMNILLYVMSMTTAAYIAAFVSLPMLVILPWVPDSAYFYCLKGNQVEAKASLQKFTGKGDVEQELSRISDGVKKELENGGNKLLDLILRPSNRKALILSMTLYFLNQLVGVNAILSFCTTIFENSRNFMSPDLSNIIYFIVCFFVCTISLFLVDVSGRKFLLVISATGSAITLFGTGTYLYIQKKTNVDLSNVEYIQLTMLLLFIIFYSIGLQTIPTLISSELFASNIKGMGLCITNITYSVAVTLVLKLFSWTSDTYGMYTPFFFFSVMAIILVIFVIFALPETKGKTLEDIQWELENTKKRKDVEMSKL